MAAFSINVANNKNKQVSLLESQTSIIEEFIQQSSGVAIGATLTPWWLSSTNESTKNFSIPTLYNKSKNTFYVARKVTSSPLRKMTHLGIAKNVSHCTEGSQFNILEEANAGIIPSVVHRRTSTSTILPITNDRSLILPAYHSAFLLSNKERK